PRAPFRLVGPDAAAVAKPEEQGLRITLAADRPMLQAVGVVLNEPLPGDFEITGTYAIVALDEAAKGMGAGVNLLISPRPNMSKMAKVADFRLAKERPRFLA